MQIRGVAPNRAATATAITLYGAPYSTYDNMLHSHYQATLTSLEIGNSESFLYIGSVGLFLAYVSKRGTWSNF